MSTEFYRIKPPFTSVRTEVGGGHTRLSLWVNHAKTGDITLRNEELKDVLRVFCREEPAVIQRGLTGGEVQLAYEDDNVEPDTILVSEYGEITCVAQLQPEGDPFIGTQTIPDEWCK